MVSTSRTSPTTPPRHQGGARDPPADAVARRHRPHRDPRPADAAGPGRPGQCRPVAAGEPTQLPGAFSSSGAASRRHAECRLPREDVARAHRRRHAGAGRRDVHQSQQRPAGDAARSAAARAPRDGRSRRRQPAPGDRRRQSPALVHRRRAGGRRGPARPRQAKGAGRVGRPASCRICRRTIRHGRHLDRRLQRLSVQRRLHRSDCDPQGHADAGRSDRRR